MVKYSILWWPLIQERAFSKKIAQNFFSLFYHEIHLSWSVFYVESNGAILFQIRPLLDFVLILSPQDKHFKYIMTFNVWWSQPNSNQSFFYSLNLIKPKIRQKKCHYDLECMTIRLSLPRRIEWCIIYMSNYTSLFIFKEMRIILQLCRRSFTAFCSGPKREFIKIATRRLRDIRFGYAVFLRNFLALKLEFFLIFLFVLPT